MDEIFQIYDEVSVLRDGQMIVTKSIDEPNLNELISAMVGRSLEQRFPPLDNTPQDTILELKEVSTNYKPYLKDISFEIKKGEIFGLYGLVGTGRSELLETLFGLRKISSGYIVYDGERVYFDSAKDEMNKNFAFVTEERKFNGLFLKADLNFNTCINNMNAYKNGLYFI